MEMHEIHDAVWEYLIKKNQQNPDLRFILRSSNRNARLEKGYWFYGNDDYLTISFWNDLFEDDAKYDLHGFPPFIRFYISKEGENQVQFNCDANDNQIQLFRDLGKALGIKRIIYENNRDLWIKEYNNSSSINKKNLPYIDSLEYFLNSDKPVIDAFLRLHDEKQRLFVPIGIKIFRESVKNIERWRALRNLTTYQNLETALSHKLEPNILKLKNIGRFKELRIDFSKQVTCFIGNNGCGKSTILKALALGFIGIAPLKKAILELNKLRNIEKLRNLLRVENASRDISYSSNGLIEFYYSLNSKSAYNRITFSQSSLDDDLEVESPTFLLNKADYLLTHLIVGFAQQVSENDSQTTNLVEPNISDVENLILGQSDEGFHQIKAWINDLISPENYPLKEERDENRRLINRIFEVITDITGDKIELMPSNNALVRTIQNPKGIQLYLVSQGYKNVIGWIGFFMKRLWEYGKIVLPDEDFTKLPAICMIDEIDTYLHPSWQHRILAGLVKHFPNVRFIITSHSPYVLSSVPSEKIDILWIDAEKSEITRLEENLFGADANRATEEIHGTKRANTEGGENIDSLISKVYSLIESNKIEEAEKILTEKLGQIDPFLDLDIVRINRLISMKKRVLNL
jgi:predicted ATP-binding protein involved in virulence